MIIVFGIVVFISCSALLDYRNHWRAKEPSERSIRFRLLIIFVAVANPVAFALCLVDTPLVERGTWNILQESGYVLASCMLIAALIASLGFIATAPVASRARAATSDVPKGALTAVANLPMAAYWIVVVLAAIALLFVGTVPLGLS